MICDRAECTYCKIIPFHLPTFPVDKKMSVLYTKEVKGSLGKRAYTTSGELKHTYILCINITRFLKKSVDIDCAAFH